MKRIIMLLIVASWLLLSGAAPSAGEADEATGDNGTVELSIRLPEPLFLGMSYDSLFRIQNLNYTKGVDSHINVTVFYNISRDGVLVKEDNFSKLVNSYTYSKTGLLFVDWLGNYTVCGYTDLGGSICEDRVAQNPLLEPCFIEVNLSLEKVIYENREKVRIKNRVENTGSKEDFPYLLEYWIEDLFGEEVKKRLNTTNSNEKSFTPKIDERDRVFIVKNRLSFVACNNSNNQTENEVMFIVRDPEFSGLCPKTGSGSSSAKKEEEHGRIQSFYTRAKKWSETINLFANLKGGEDKEVVLKTRFGDDSQRLDGPEKIFFEAKAEPGKNLYVLELFEEGKLVDAKSLTVELEGGPEENGSEEIVLENITVIHEEPVMERRVTPEEIHNATPKMSEMVTGEVVYETGSARLGGYAPYFVIVLLLLVIAALLKRKK